VKYDCIIIGGGLSGLVCGIKCAKEGLRTAIFSGGMNSLHFSSGSIDLLGYSDRKKIVRNPFDDIKSLRTSAPDHPYLKLPLKTIKDSLDFLTEELEMEDLSLYSNGNFNHFRITALGTLKPTYLSQKTVYNETLKRAIENNITIAILNFEGFRDYYPELAVERLKKNRLLKNINFTTGRIELPFFSRSVKDFFDPGSVKDLLESNSIDIARLFETEKYLPGLAQAIKKVAGKADIAMLPAFLGLDNYKYIHKRLCAFTGLLISEIPVLPPSILGMRIDSALKARFSSLGGEFIAGDRVTGGEIINGKLDHIHTANYGDARHYSKYYVLSTGSFISSGLSSGFNTMEEPVFNLQMNREKNRGNWYSKNFFDPESHPFLSFGVSTDKNFNPYDKNGDLVENLFCIGSVLSGYDPVREGSGGGVAVSTGYCAAQKIMKKVINI
jgi:glycerol-3-phosphate dehydrogenase subunit B